MTQTHTPGPWRIGDAGATIFGPKTDKPAPVMIASIEKAGGAHKANARLIAAAPDLLAALEAILAPFDSMPECDRIELCKSDDQYHNARAAITKAKGE